MQLAILSFVAFLCILTMIEVLLLIEINPIGHEARRAKPWQWELYHWKEFKDSSAFGCFFIFYFIYNLWLNFTPFACLSCCLYMPNIRQFAQIYSVFIFQSLLLEWSHLPALFENPTYAFCFDSWCQCLRIHLASNLPGLLWKPCVLLGDLWNVSVCVCVCSIVLWLCVLSLCVLFCKYFSRYLGRE